MDNKVKKKRNNSNKVIIILTSLFITSTIGSLTGTYAWFEYSARAKLQYHGTAISEHKILEIGLWSPIELPDAEKYNLYKDPVNPEIYWAKNVLDAEMLAYYTNSTGCATNVLTPLTSGSFTEKDAFSLKPAPKNMENYDPNSVAEKIDFVHIPLRFRVRAGLSLGDGTQMIVLNKLDLKFSGEAYEGARIHFGSETSNFILNPSSKDNGHTIVGGPLDLNLDGFYDYTNLGNKEICYGEVKEGKLIYFNEPSTNEIPMDENTRSCFLSAHALGMYGIDKEKSTFKTADYFGLNQTLIIKELTRMTPDNRIASLDMDIYVEGWEDSIIDQSEEDQFSLDLTFEVQEI